MTGKWVRRGDGTDKVWQVVPIFYCISLAVTSRSVASNRPQQTKPPNRKTAMRATSSIGVRACRCGVVLSLVAAHHSTAAFHSVHSTSLAYRQSTSCPTRRSPRYCSQASTAAAAIISGGKDDVNEQGDTIVPKEKAYSKLSRLYVGGDPGRASATLCKGARVQLSADQSHYLSNVMRFGKGKRNKRHGSSGDDGNLAQCVRLFDGESGEWLARVSAVEDDDADTDAGRKKNRRQKRGAPSNLSAECLLQLRQQHHGNEDLPWLLFAPIKKHRAKFLVEKCTELGAGKFVPIITDRTDPAAVTGCIGIHQSMDALEKLSVQALEASEQCERLSVPVVAPNIAASSVEEQETWDVPTLLEKWCASDIGYEGITADRRLLICRERMPGNGILSRLESDGGPPKRNKKSRVAFLVGPEGGWSEEEEKLIEQYAAQHHEIIQSVSLGDFVLRAETAAMTCIASWNLSRDNELMQ